MRKPEQTPEPSIEEILASIRKIIADDGTQVRSASAAADFPRQVPNLQPSVHSFESARPARPHHQRSQQGPGPEPDDEILELTEDFVLGDQAAQLADESQSHRFENAESGGGAALEPSSATEDDIDERGLESVLSNVAAEVERLAAGDGRGGARSAFFYDDMERAAPEDERGSSARHSGPANSSEAAAPDVPAADSQPPARTPPAERPRMHSRQLWSARRPESEGAQAGQRGGAAPQAQDTRPAQQGTIKGRDRWAEGVQMPVPETGPTMPFPYASEEEPNARSPAPAGEDDQFEAREDYAASEDEKSFVGDFLTRVFGGSTQQDDEELPSAPGLKGKAEGLAKATVSDFASDKLGAPAVAGALHADRPFMDQITESLESALAKAEAMDDDAFDAEESVADRLAHDELSDIPPPPDAEFAPFDEIDDEDSAAPVSGEGPLGAPPAASMSDAAAAGLDLAAAHPDALFGDAGPSREAPRPDQAPAAKAPERQDRSPAIASGDARVKQDAPAMGGNALPDGIEASIKEMIKPLIMQWLNDNLARIVEQAVREELADRRGDLADLHPRGGQR
jgi:cell pole-organizing protein PopZ